MLPLSPLILPGLSTLKTPWSAPPQVSHHSWSLTVSSHPFFQSWRLKLWCRQSRSTCAGVAGFGRLPGPPCSIQLNQPLVDRPYLLPITNQDKRCGCPLGISPSRLTSINWHQDPFDHLRLTRLLTLLWSCSSSLCHSGSTSLFIYLFFQVCWLLALDFCLMLMLQNPQHLSAQPAAPLAHLCFHLIASTSLSLPVPCLFFVKVIPLNCSTAAGCCILDPMRTPTWTKSWNCHCFPLLETALEE